MNCGFTIEITISNPCIRVATFECDGGAMQYTVYPDVTEVFDKWFRVIVISGLN